LQKVIERGKKQHLRESTKGKGEKGPWVEESFSLGQGKSIIHNKGKKKKKGIPETTLQSPDQKNRVDLWGRGCSPNATKSEERRQERPRRRPMMTLESIFERKLETGKKKTWEKGRSQLGGR